MKSIKILITALLIAVSFSLSATQNTVRTYKITTFDSIPVRNATIQILGTNQMIKSDSLGSFNLSDDFRGKIKITASGFVSRIAKVNEKSHPLKFNLTSKRGKKAIQLAINSGHIIDKEKFYASIKNSKQTPDYSTYDNVLDIIKGRFPGVKVEGNKVIIRGKSSIFGSNGALIEVDGVVMSNNILETLSPGEVKKISILKGSQLTMYGSRGVNGVVAIQTKSNK